jgi:hypothetical protein
MHRFPETASAVRNLLHVIFESLHTERILLPLSHEFEQLCMCRERISYCFIVQNKQKLSTPTEQKNSYLRWDMMYCDHYLKSGFNDHSTSRDELDEDAS